MSINGLPVQHEIEERTLLVTFIRDVCRLTGTHIGCDTAQCGACTVHLNGRAIKSCSILAVEAFKVHHGLQCGYCTPGMIMSAIDLVNKIPHPTKDEIREQLDGNLCRCTGYHNIVHAVHEAARLMNP
jgi:carbon-monoxide dehydrogenase small subunit